jgi:hypothetical protein
VANMRQSTPELFGYPIWAGSDNSDGSYLVARSLSTTGGGSSTTSLAAWIPGVSGPAATLIIAVVAVILVAAVTKWRRG